MYPTLLLYEECKILHLGTELYKKKKNEEDIFFLCKRGFLIPIVYVLSIKSSLPKFLGGQLKDLVSSMPDLVHAEANANLSLPLFGNNFSRPLSGFQFKVFLYFLFLFSHVVTSV